MFNCLSIVIYRVIRVKVSLTTSLKRTVLQVVHRKSSTSTRIPAHKKHNCAV
jgi:hypothetical protein